MHCAESTTNPSLLERLRGPSADRIAWIEFVDRYQARIHNWCRRWGLQPADADDVTQNVLLQLSRQIGRFEYNPTLSFRGWLKTVTYRAWCDYLTQLRRRRDRASGDSAALRFLDTVAARDDLLAEFEQAGNRQLLEEAMRRVQSRVQPRTWEVFRLMPRHRLTGPQVARRLTMKVGAVWVAKSKVQRMIHDEIRKLDSRSIPAGPPHDDGRRAG